MRKVMVSEYKQQPDKKLYGWQKKGNKMETVQDSRLPKSPLFWIKWQGFWFRHVADSIGLERRLWPRIWMTMRGANFWQAWMGPVHFGWRRPWLKGPAEQHLAQFYSDV